MAGVRRHPNGGNVSPVLGSLIRWISSRRSTRVVARPAPTVPRREFDVAVERAGAEFWISAD